MSFETILPAVLKKRGYEFVGCEFDQSVGQDQFMSTVKFLRAIVKRENQILKIPLVAKFEHWNVELRNYLNTNIQFYNEVLMYEKVLPLLNKSNICKEIFADFFHGVGILGESENSIVIVEDLRPKGFKLTRERVFLDLEHLSLAMSKLGKFHALSYVAKKESPSEFYKLAASLKEPTWIEVKSIHKILKVCFHRPAEYLVNKGKHVKVLQRLLSSFDSSINKFMKKMLDPEEPQAVICHGDFCRNNILFAYNDDGSPKDVRFFDVATSRYSTPAVDISFMLLLNSSSKTRRDHWDDLLATYHNALTTAVPGAEVPSLEEVRKEVVAKAMYGFVHCSFFLPVMAYDNPYNDLEQVMNADQDEVADEYARIGGEDGTKLLADMLEELIDRGCVTLEREFMLCD